MADSRATSSNSRSDAAGRRCRWKRSLETEVEIMKRIASHVSTSVENTAASARAPSQGGSSSVSTVGNTRSGAFVWGSATRPTIPSRTGRNANSISATPLSATPVRRARALSAPYDFWMSPGEITNAGPVSASSVHPEPGPDEYERSTNVEGSVDDRNADGPPTPATANGTATAKPTSMTINCSVLTQAVPSSPPAVK